MTTYFEFDTLNTFKQDISIYKNETKKNKMFNIQQSCRLFKTNINVERWETGGISR